MFSSKINTTFDWIMTSWLTSLYWPNSRICFVDEILSFPPKLLQSTTVDATIEVDIIVIVEATNEGV